MIGENAAELPAALNVTISSGGPTIAMRTNPVDPYSKVLVLTGDNADDLVTAAEVLTLQAEHAAGRSDQRHRSRTSSPPASRTTRRAG